MCFCPIVDSAHVSQMRIEATACEALQKFRRHTSTSSASRAKGHGANNLYRSANGCYQNMSNCNGFERDLNSLTFSASYVIQYRSARRLTVPRIWKNTEPSVYPPKALYREFPELPSTQSGKQRQDKTQSWLSTCHRSRYIWCRINYCKFHLCIICCIVRLTGLVG